MCSQETPEVVSKLSRQRLDKLCDLIRDTYTQDNRPWIIGYSGGKDSTATLQLVWYALSELSQGKFCKPVYVISSDTYVETPIVVDHINSNIEAINRVSEDRKIPILALKVTPRIEDTFWVNMIGKGYPAPYNRFRWCTDRLKIEPANRFIKEQVSKYGEVIIVLGARRSESATRAQVMNQRRNIGERLSRHSELSNAWVLTPIEDWTSEDVWEYLLNIPSPWRSSNHELLTMYRNAQGEECPLVIDKTTPPCGNSRFGCWTCTVVSKDSSMESMIDRGQHWLEPLLEIRNWLAETLDPAIKKKVREFRRRTGHVEFRGDSGAKKLIMGPYKLDFRKTILKRLLEAQCRVQADGPDDKLTLISREELLEIRKIWHFEEGDWEDSLPKICQEVTGHPLKIPRDDWSGMGGAEHIILEKVSKQHELPVGLLSELFDAEKRLHGMSRRAGIFDSIDSIFRKDWRSFEEIPELRVGIESDTQDI